MIPVVDLFAGPGGLGEGFCSFKKNSIFNIILSVEKEKFACETLLLRSFFHQFKKKPNDYYDYLKGNISKDKLFSKYPKKYLKAKNSILNIEMGVGKNSLIVSDTIKQLIPNQKQHWILLGGPPCQAYSIAGRSKLKNLKGVENFEKDKRHTLYKQYLQIISKNGPSVFIMENVKGLISSKIKGKSTLTNILMDLKFPDKTFKNIENKEYNLFSFNDENDLFAEDNNFIINCSEHGVPQRRQRIFIVGIKKDLNIKGLTPLKKEEEVPIHKVLSDLPKIRSIISKETDSHQNWIKIFENLISTTDEKLLLQAKKKALTINEFGSLYIKTKKEVCKYKPDWFHDGQLGGVLNHETRRYLKGDIERYIYASIFADKNNTSIKISDFPKKLLPNHKNIYSDKIIFSDRFRVQLRNLPATTITSHISKDGHYYIHYDTSQARSLTVREAARIQTFPDNYFFEGNKTQQYVQVGNAVPPLIANKIAAIIFNDVFKKIN